MCWSNVIPLIMYTDYCMYTVDVSAVLGKLVIAYTTNIMLFIIINLLSI